MLSNTYNINIVDDAAHRFLKAVRRQVGGLGGRLYPRTSGHAVL